jgi:hypothetical protein
VKRIPEVRVCRREGTVLMSTCVVVATTPTPHQLVHGKPKSQEDLPVVKMQYVDTLPGELGQKDPLGFVTYAVEEMNKNGRSGGLSNQVAIAVAPTIPAPENLSAEVSGEGVGISWQGPELPSAPQGLSYQYRITRRLAGPGAYIGVAEVPPSAKGEYLDKTAGWEQKYEYRITTATQVHSPGHEAVVEGEDSKPVEVYTRDIYPPAQPAGLQAVFSSVGQKPFIDLTWAPNLEGDLAGYNVFRRTGGGSWQKLNQQLVQGSSFRDENVEPGKVYGYSISAVDLRGNESPRSAEASETVPNP